MSEVTWGDLTNMQMRILKRAFNEAPVAISKTKGETIGNYKILANLGLLETWDGADGFYAITEQGQDVYIAARLPVPVPSSPFDKTPESNLRMAAGQAAVEMPVDQLEAEYVKAALRIRELEAERDALKADVDAMQPFVRMVAYAGGGELNDKHQLIFDFDTPELASAAWDAMHTSWSVIYNEDMAALQMFENAVNEETDTDEA